MSRRRYKPSLDRGQTLLLPERVEDYVGENHQVRALDAYVDTLDLASMEFRYTEAGTIAGHPPYNPWAMLKLYLYGYQNGIRSSKLEAETGRNLEVIWLVRGMRPSYKSIADFRRNHAAQLREVNKDFVMLCRDLSLFGGNEVAVDGSFFSADAGKASIQTRGYIERGLENIESRIEQQYQQELEEADAADEKAGIQDAGDDEVLSEKMEKLNKRQKERQELKCSMERSGDTQVSTVDKDARILRKRGQSVAGYNAQTAVDSKHKLVVVEQVVQDGSDSRQLSGMLMEANRRLGAEQMTGPADGGGLLREHGTQAV